MPEEHACRRLSSVPFQRWDVLRQLEIPEVCEYARAAPTEKLGIHMAPFSDNPFAALTIVVAPAILTNVSSALCLGTANRLARVLDRTRVVSAQIAHLTPEAENSVISRCQLESLR